MVATVCEVHGLGDKVCHSVMYDEILCVFYIV